MLTIIQGHPHATYGIVIGGFVLACCIASVVSWVRCEKARRDHVRRLMRKAFDAAADDALSVVDDAEARSYVMHPAVKERAIRAVGDEAEAWLKEQR